MFDDGCCAQSEADLADDFITSPSSRDASAAVDGRSVAPVSKLTKPAPATDAATLKAEMKRWYGRISAGAHT